MDKEKIAKLQAQVRIGMSSNLPLPLVVDSEKENQESGSVFKRNLADMLYPFPLSYRHYTRPAHYSHTSRLPPIPDLDAFRAGGKGTPRRKFVKKSVTATQGDDRKLQAALKKLGTQPITGVEEVNMFKEDGNVLHFNVPRGESRLV
jgi:hypothetical protein